MIYLANKTFIKRESSLGPTCSNWNIVFFEAIYLANKSATAFPSKFERDFTTLDAAEYSLALFGNIGALSNTRQGYWQEKFLNMGTTIVKQYFSLGFTRVFSNFGGVLSRNPPTEKGKFSRETC